MRLASVDVAGGSTSQTGPSQIMDPQQYQHEQHYQEQAHAYQEQPEFQPGYQYHEGYEYHQGYQAQLNMLITLEACWVRWSIVMSPGGRTSTNEM